MEESKTTTILVAVEKSSSLTEQQLRDYINSPDAKFDANSSPKGWRVLLDSEQATTLLDKGVDTLNGEDVNFAEIDAYCTIYIKGITEEIKEGDLAAALNQYGRICMTSIPRDANHKPKGMSFVRFNRKADAITAAENNPTLEVNKLTLEVSKYDGKTKDVVNESASFKNIPEGYGVEELHSLLGEFGQITDIRINKDNNSGIVFYSTSGSVQKAVQQLNGKLLLNKTFFINVNEAEKKRATAYNNLYVGNVSTDASEASIREEFEKHGEIESLLLPTRKVKNEKGEFIEIRKPFIYISFKDSKAASNVIKEMDSRHYWGGQLDIDYYDPDRKRNNREKHAPQAPPNNQNLMQDFANAMMMMMSQFSNMNMRGRGGHSGHGSGGYRGGNNYGGRGRGGGRGGARGTQRGGRGRGGPGYYNVRSQYEQKPMMGGPGMGMPPMGGMAPAMNTAPPMTHSMPNTGFNQPASNMSQPPSHGFTEQPPMYGGAGPTTSVPGGAPVGMTQPHAAEPEPQEEEEINVLELGQEQYSAHENEIGTYLYNKIEQSHGTDLAGRIAGMFLDLPPVEVHSILHDEVTYQKYISDAEELIKNEGEGDAQGE